MKAFVIPFDNTRIINIIYTAGRTCYSKEGPISIWEETQRDCSKEAIDKRVKLINQILGSGHLSVAEHASFTILIEGVSRALTHQLVRHRSGISYSQQSQRYCEFDKGFKYVKPESINKNLELSELLNSTMASLEDVYDILVSNGIPAEDARCVLPNACTTNITVTCNLRELMHIANERLCTCAQQEIRALVDSIIKQICKELPFLKEYLVPKCELLGYCNESSKRTCGRKSLKKVVVNKER